MRHKCAIVGRRGGIDDEGGNDEVGAEVEGELQDPHVGPGVGIAGAADAAGEEVEGAAVAEGEAEDGGHEFGSEVGEEDAVGAGAGVGVGVERGNGP